MQCSTALLSIASTSPPPAPLYTPLLQPVCTASFVPPVRCPSRSIDRSLNRAMHQPINHSCPAATSPTCTSKSCWTTLGAGTAPSCRWSSQVGCWTVRRVPLLPEVRDASAQDGWRSRVAPRRRQSLQVGDGAGCCRPRGGSVLLIDCVEPGHCRQLDLLPCQGAQVPAADCGHHALLPGGWRRKI